MNKIFIAGIGVGIATFSILFMPMLLTSNQIEAAIPPTPAWSKIGSNDTDVTTNAGWANATQYNSELWIITDGSILIEVIPYTGGLE